MTSLRGSGVNMREHDTELLRRIENLIRAFQSLVRESVGSGYEESVVYGLRALVSLANMVLRGDEVFCIEPWHVIGDTAPLSQPGEMLLRIKDFKGQPMPPYPAVMAFYNHGFTAEIDGILFLAALWQFQRSDEKQVSINISARSLRDNDFVKCTLERLEALDLASDEKVIIEIHESTPHLEMSRQVLELYSRLGVEFAIDDVGLNMGDIMRLSEFEGLATYVKIDRHTVCAQPEASNSLVQVMNFVRALMPDVTLVAEGVQDGAHACALAMAYPDIAYVQGLYLPNDRRAFDLDFYNAMSVAKGMAAE
jgi:EAL domain-containing protein (putative c-di-GMP-specific phosphodiesterase class I)